MRSYLRCRVRIDFVKLANQSIMALIDARLQRIRIGPEFATYTCGKGFANAIPSSAIEAKTQSHANQSPKRA
jgi:hypothetical protein